MAVTTTPRDILNGAYGKSTKNRPGTIATEATELLQLVIRAMRGLYSAAARINPFFFAEDAAVAFAAPGWARPETAEAVVKLERTATTTGGVGAAGDEVKTVSFKDRTAEIGFGAVYPFGQKYRSAGNANDPTGGPLQIFYSKLPTSPATIDTVVDALWREAFNELLMLEVAIYLALKDDRGGELGALTAERNRWLPLYIAHLEHETIGVLQRFGNVHRFNVAEIMPLLAGGA